MNAISDDADDTLETPQLNLPVSTTVLIVDDDHLVLAWLQDRVTAAGYVVRTADSGTAALQSLAISPVSIVIADIQMPGMDGLDLCRTIRARDWPSYIYIILLTVQDREKDIVAGLEAGADDYLSKHASTRQLTARLRSGQRILALEYSLRDALEKKRLLAMSDSLTGAYNRRYFVRHFSRELKRAQRFGGYVSLLLLDIDQFKSVNDNYGHAVGDVVLRSVSALIEKCFRRATDWCARLGGDEFVIVLEGTSLADGQICAEKLRGEIAASLIDTPAGIMRITVSIGVSGLEGIVNGNAATVDSLLEHADANLYKAKANGRNCVTSPSLTTTSDEHGTQQRLNHVSKRSTVRLVR